MERSATPGLNDNTLKGIKKGKIKDLKQDLTERVRDFQKRIDDMYSWHMERAQQQVMMPT